MATDYTYPDAYLSKFCTADREERAKLDVAVMGTFSTAWTERLTILRVYILACLENQADADDLFGTKLKHYRAEFDTALPQARAQAALDASLTAGTINSFGILSIPLERG